MPVAILLRFSPEEDVPATNKFDVVQSIVNEFVRSGVTLNKVGEDRFEGVTDGGYRFALYLPADAAQQFYNAASGEVGLVLDRSPNSAWRMLMGTNVGETIWRIDYIAENMSVNPGSDQLVASVELDGGFEVKSLLPGYPRPVDLPPGDYHWTAYPPDGYQEDT